MPYVLRQNDYPPLNVIQQIPQIVIVDKTGPVLSTGSSNKAVCVVGEFLKGPFTPTEITGSGELSSFYGGLIAPASSRAIISQAAVSAGLQDGNGVGFDGNGVAQLKGKIFKRLIIQRVDTEAVTTSGGATKGTVSITVTGTPSPTTQDITIPAGTLFGDNASYASATVIVATSQDYVIPKGATSPATVVANVFFVRGITVGIAGLTTVMDSVIPSVTGYTITAVANATTLFPPGTGGTLSLLITSQYGPAIDKTLPTDSPMIDIGVVWAARNNATIRPLAVANGVSAAGQGPGRVVLVAADPATANTVAAASTAKSAAIALAGTESYAQPADRAIICFPHIQIFAAELGANITVSNQGYMASILSNRPEEENPGAENSTYTSTIQGYEAAFQTSPLTKQDYINLKAGGVSALQKDRSAGWWYADGVTAANSTTYPTRTQIKRRRMADFIQDTLVQLAAKYEKKPATQDRVDAFVTEIDSFLLILKSPQNTGLQRIVDYRIDSKSRNTAALQRLGIQVILVAVQTLPGMDDIVLETVIGETVNVQEGQ